MEKIPLKPTLAFLSLSNHRRLCVISLGGAALICLVTELAGANAGVCLGLAIFLILGFTLLGLSTEADYQRHSNDDNSSS